MYYSTDSRRIVAGWTSPGPETASSTAVTIKSCGARSIVAGSSKEPSTNVSHRLSGRYGRRDAPVVELEATPVAYTCSWSVNGSTASTAWPRPSRPGRLGCTVQSLRLDGRGSQRYGPARTWSPLSAAQHWRSSDAMWRTNPTHKPRTDLPLAEARGFSGFSR
jgi:hypothetical protein